MDPEYQCPDREQRVVDPSDRALVAHRRPYGDVRTEALPGPAVEEEAGLRVVLRGEVRPIGSTAPAAGPGATPVEAVFAGGD